MHKLLVFTLLLLSITANAVRVDSLLQVYHSQKDITSKFNTLKSICSYYTLVNTDSAQYFSEKLLELSKQSNDNSLIAEALYQQGVYNKKNGNISKAFQLYNEALKIWQSLNDTANVSKSYNALGVAYSEDGNLDFAIEYLSKALQIKKTINDTKGIGITLFNIGNIYINKAYYDSALYNYNEATKYFKAANFEIGMASCMNSIGVINEIMENYDSALVYYNKALETETRLNNYDGMVNAYNNIGNVYSIKGMNPLALKNYQLALEYSELLNNKNDISNALKNIGLIHTFSSDFKEANSYLTRAVKIAYDIGKKETSVNILHAIGYSYTFQEKCDSALIFLNKSLEIATEINYVDMISKNYSMLAQAYLCVGNGKKAFECYQKFNKINEQTNQQLNNLKIQLVSSQKEKQIEELRLQNEKVNEELKKQRILIISGIIILLLIITLVIIIYRNRNLKNRHKTSELKHKVLQLQMNPHFIHNALASIEGYLYVHEPHMTAEYISEFSHLMRSILENSRKDFIPVQDEAETLREYLDLQKFRYKDKFEYEINISEAIDQEYTLIPPMLSQPFVENSIEHGIMHLEKGGKLKIGFRLDKNNLIISIEDNGVGLKKSAELEQKHKHSHNPLAIQITNERLAAYSSLRKNNYSLKINDIINDGKIEGTIVLISIPYKII